MRIILNFKAEIAVWSIGWSISADEIGGTLFGEETGRAIPGAMRAKPSDCETGGNETSSALDFALRKLVRIRPSPAFHRPF
ncbi:hypothetical protein [Pseudoduganella lurida]|uniref:hypothetical protein n=1 Tax=Pseudoduganella lurida TaxID=1036180 RepID=UPI0011AA8AB3|nr:hypothetical protein [Pseudoduganella lurida]